METSLDIWVSIGPILLVYLLIWFTYGSLQDELLTDLYKVDQLYIVGQSRFVGKMDNSECDKA